MPLPPPAPRAPQHTRTTVFRGYRRDDGLWDIEGELLDTKSVPFEIPGDGVWQPGEAIHGLKIRVTIDPAFTVRDIAVSMDDVPHPECPQAQGDRDPPGRRPGLRPPARVVVQHGHGRLSDPAR